MITHQRSFHLITSPVGQVLFTCPSSSSVVVAFHIKRSHFSSKNCNRQVHLLAVRPFYSAPLLFLLYGAASAQSCCTTQESQQVAGRANWAGSPSEIRAAIRAYLLARWNCLTRAHGQQEEILLSSTGSETAEMQRFLAALQQFYRFAIKRGYYWYEGNPAAVFSLPMRSRLRQALSGAFRSLATRHPGNKDEGWNELPRQGNTPTALHEELPFPAEAWMQFVPVAEPVAMRR